MPSAILLFLPIPNALFILGLYWITSEDNLLHGVRRFLDRWGLDKDGEGRTWYYPVLYCYQCMSSVWGILFFVGAVWLTGSTWNALWWLPVHVLGTFGTVEFLWARYHNG